MQQQQERHQREISGLHQASRSGYFSVMNSNSPIHSPKSESYEISPVESNEEKLAKELEDERRKLAELQKQILNQPVSSNSKEEEEINPSPTTNNSQSMMSAEDKSTEEENNNKLSEPEEEEDEEEEAERETTEDTINSPDKKRVMTVTPLRKHLYKPTKVFRFYNNKFKRNY